MKYTEKPLSKNLSEKRKTTAGSIGALGEEAAVKTLRKYGYRIVERNFKTKMGEIDIIAKDGEYTCFIEVKLRKRNDFGTPADAIDSAKRRRIINTAMLYAKMKNIYDTPMRFDAVLINADTVDGRLENVSIEVVKDAFRL